MQKKSAAELSELINNHVADLQRIGANWSNEILVRLKQAQEELMKYILSEQKSFGAVSIDVGTNKKFEIIHRRIEMLLNQAYGQALGEIQAQAPLLAENDAKWAASLTKSVAGQTVEQVGKRTFNNIVRYGRYNGLTLAEMFNSMAVSDANKIFKEVSQNIVAGTTPFDLKKAVQRAFDVSNYQAQSMGLTCANGIANDAKLAVYSENADVVKGIMILNTLDGRTCPSCAELGGRRYKMDDKELPVLPVHIRCRCVYLPVTELSDMSTVTRPAANADFMAEAKRAYEEKYKNKSWEDLANSTKKNYYHKAIHYYEKRTGKNAFRQVPGSMKFKDYFESQSAQFQKDWLGPTRYRLYQKGKLSLNQMMDPETNKMFTISELKKRDISAFRRAGLL